LWKEKRSVFNDLLFGLFGVFLLSRAEISQAFQQLIGKA
jgi:hypothetical protein